MKQTKPLTDAERLRLRHSLSLNGKTFRLTVDESVLSVSFKLTKKNDTLMEVHFRNGHVWWLSESDGFVRRVRLVGMQSQWASSLDNVEPPCWWTFAKKEGGNKILPQSHCKKLEEVFQLALSESIAEAILS